MARVLGLGGLFMSSKDAEATKAWYAKVFDMPVNDYGGFDFLHADTAAPFPRAARTVFTAFEATSDYFAPSTESFMLNLIVDDLQGVLAKLKDHGIEPVQPSESFEYGHFAWIMDPDGRKIELWQPVEPKG